MITEDIIICPKCEGKGYTTRDECVDYHRSEYTTIREHCKTCNGSGRLKRTTTVKIEPYEPKGVK